MSKPDNIIIYIKDEKGNPVNDIVLELKLFATHKNDYYMITPLSDNGKIEITKVWIERIIYNTASSAIMDYSSNYEGCKNIFSLKLLSGDKISSIRELQIKNQKYYKITYEEISNLENSENYMYTPQEWEFEFHSKDMRLDIVIEKKSYTEIEEIEATRIIRNRKEILKEYELELKNRKRRALAIKSGNNIRFIRLGKWFTRRN